MVEAILQIYVHVAHSRIVACTPSNSAADLLVSILSHLVHLAFPICHVLSLLKLLMTFSD